MPDPRGDRADAGQAEHLDDGGPVSCHFCGEEVSSFDLPDHFIEEHAPDVGGSA